MKTLNLRETEIVSGGIGPWGAIMGATAAGIGQYMSGADARGIAAGMAFGALSGFTGGLAGATTGLVRVGWSVRSVATGVISGLDTSQDNELEQAK